ncbi:MAG: hypothetical protein VXW15_04940 [Bdellovibrionota bacterium]|nr:hypothetical protein [Bdellovibrionota bacterium]
MEQKKQYTLDSTVYVGNLNYKRDQEGLKKLFSKYGKVQSVKLVMESGQDRSKGIAFIKMRKPEQAQGAIKGLNGALVDGRTLKVSLALTSDSPKKPLRDEKTFSQSAQDGFDQKEKEIKQKKKKVKKGLNELFEYLKSKS